MAICAFQKDEPDSLRHLNRWRGVLLDARNGDQFLPPSFIDELSRSFIPSPYVPRIGGFIRFKPEPSSAWDIFERYMSLWNVPVIAELSPDEYAEWCSHRGSRTPPHPIIPSRATLDPLIREAEKAIRSSQDPATIPPPPPPPRDEFVNPQPAGPAPNPTFNSGQRRGEHVRDFMQRRAEMNEKKREVETPEERAKREAREKKFCQFPSPKDGNDFPSYYEWVQVGNWWLRKWMTAKTARKRYWTSDDHADKRYDGFSHQVDICDLFDEGFMKELKPVADDPVYEDLSSIQQAIPYVEPPEDPDNAFNFGALAEEVKVDVDEDDIRVGLPVHDRLFYSYGLRIPPGSPIPTPSIAMLPWDSTKTALGILHDGKLDAEARATLQAFATFPAMKRKFDGATEEFCDLMPHHPLSLHGRHPNFAVGHLPQPYRKDNTSEEDRNWYILLPHEDIDREFRDIPCDLAFDNPLSALVAVRAVCTSVERQPAIRTVSGLANFLAKHGVPFRTLRPTLFPRVDVVEGTATGLGVRKTDFRPTLRDLEVYHELLHNFFRHPRSRAALTYGGIIWRIAIDHMAWDGAGEGPSFVWSGLGCEWDHIAGFVLADRTELHDDCLSQSDVNLISGMYYVWTADRASEQWSSFFPRPEAWRLGKMGGPMWSPVAERWYLERRETIRVACMQGREVLKNQAEWKRALIDRRARRFMTAHENEAEAYIKTNLPPNTP